MHLAVPGAVAHVYHIHSALAQVSVPRCRLLIEGIIVHNLLVKGEQNSGSVLPPLGQSAMNVVNVRHCPWYCEVHGSGLTHQVL